MKKMLAALSLSILMMLEPVLAEPPITSTDLQPADPAVVSEAPATEAPATEVPVTETPATETPAMETPATETPATEPPATEPPATEAPATKTPAAYAAGLARLERETVLYGNSSLSVVCLSLRHESIVFAIEASENQQAVRIAFNGGAELGYAWVKASEVIRLDAAELAEYQSRNHGEDAIVYRNVVLEPVVRRSSATEEPAEEPTEEPATEPTEEPAEEPVTLDGPVYEYVVAEHGALVLDEQGNPQPIVPDGAEKPVSYLRDETGALVLVDGKPVVLATLPAGAGVVTTLQDQLNQNRSIDVYATWEGEALYLDSEATLIAVLHGYDNAVYTLQWQYSPDNATWYDLEGAEEARCTLTVTEENYQYYWRIQATITGVIGQ